MTTPLINGKKLSDIRVLVTGGGGFIGSNVVHGLNARGITQITIVDRLGSGTKWRNLVGLRYAEYIEVDAFRARRKDRASDYDIAFLLGARSSTRELDASYLASNNLSDLIETIDWLKIPRWVHLPSGGYNLTPNPRIIYASSAATYGSGTQSDALSPADCRPNNAYALSKNMVDQTLESRGLLSQVVGLKLFNVFGPGSAHKGEMVDFVSKTYQSIKDTGSVTLYDTHIHGPTDARDFLYVKDAVDMTLFFALDEKGRQASGLFNIGSGAAFSWTNVAASVMAAMGISPTLDRIRYQPMPADLRSRYQYHTLADLTKLRAAGCQTLITPIYDAVADYVTTYLVPDKRRGEA